MSRRYKHVRHGVDKSTMTCESEDETGPFSGYLSLASRRHNVKMSVPPTQEVCLIGRMFPCIPYWAKKRSASHLTARKGYSGGDVTRANSTDDDGVEVKYTFYSEEEEIFPDKKQMLQAKQRARKVMRQKLKEEEKTCKRYKMKAKEIEKQFEIFEREIKRKREALRKKPEPSKSDEEISRVLNTLLCTNIHYDPDIITKIKILLQEKPKLQGYFNECSHNNSLPNHLKYKLFSRVGVDSKLKFFLNSKKRMNTEHRDLLRAIMDQVNQEYGDEEKKRSAGDTVIDKICRILWRRPERHSTGACVRQENQAMPQEQEHTYPGIHSQKRRYMTFHRDNIEHKKKTTKINKKVYRGISDLENNIAKNEKKNRPTHTPTCDSNHNLRSRSHGCSMKLEGCDAKGQVSHCLQKSQHIRLEKLRLEALKEKTYTNESDIEEEIRSTKLGDTGQPTAMATRVATTRFNLLGFLKSTPNKNNNTNDKDNRKDSEAEYDDVIHNGRRRQHRKCFRCDQETETDVDAQYLTDFDQKSDDREDSTEIEQNKAGGSYKIWNLFKKDHRKQKTIWTNK